ncbi:MAG: hypothetical protein ACREF8_02360 [Chthoniobacterales bacterium]
METSDAPKSLHLKEKWDRYIAGIEEAKSAMPEGLREMLRLSFYCGAATVFDRVLAAGRDENEHEGPQMMADMDSELFAVWVETGVKAEAKPQ